MSYQFAVCVVAQGWCIDAGAVKDVVHILIIALGVWPYFSVFHPAHLNVVLRLAGNGRIGEVSVRNGVISQVAYAAGREVLGSAGLVFIVCSPRWIQLPSLMTKNSSSTLAATTNAYGFVRTRRMRLQLPSPPTMTIRSRLRASSLRLSGKINIEIRAVFQILSECLNYLFFETYRAFNKPCFV